MLSLEELEECGISSEWVEIGVMLDPLPMAESVVDRLRERFDRVGSLVLHRECARDVVQHGRIFRLHLERAARPVP